MLKPALFGLLVIMLGCSQIGSVLMQQHPAFALSFDWVLSPELLANSSDDLETLKMPTTHDNLWTHTKAKGLPH